jgi:hypothetical protein
MSWRLRALKEEGESLIEQLVADPEVGLFDPLGCPIQLDEPDIRREFQDANGPDDAQSPFRGSLAAILVDDNPARLDIRGERNGGCLPGTQTGDDHGR